MNMLGIVFSNIYDSSMGDLTKTRTMASLPFGGRYRIIDFPLSNMCNSGVKKVGIITRYNYRSLMDHLLTSTEWDFNSKNGGLYFLPPFLTGTSNVYRGKIEALSNAVNFLEHSTEQYVLLCDPMVICNIDYNDALKSHIASKKDITIIANDEYATGNGQYLDVVMETDGKKVESVALNVVADKGTLAGMGMFIMDRNRLLEVVKHSVSRGLFHFERDFIQRSFLDGTLSINAYNFKDVVIRVMDVESYYKSNLELLKDSVRKGIFKEKTPIYSKVRDEEPTFYYDGSSVKNCLVADGCKIQGRIENSLIFRDVIIEEGATVENSIVMTGSVIKKNARISQAIIDKDVTVNEGRALFGATSSPIIIGKGAVI